MDNEIEDFRIKNIEIWRRLFTNVALELLGIVTASMRGVTINFDGKTFQITVIFGEKPTSEEIEDLEDMELQVISSHEYFSDLEILVVPFGQKISHLRKNFGWVFLRKE